MRRIAYLTAIALLGPHTATAATVAEAPLVSIPVQDAFFEALRAHCGKAFEGNAPAYGVVYNFEIILLFLTLIVIGPLARHWRTANFKPSAKFGLGELPG